MLPGGLIISRRFVQVRTAPKHWFAHISNYQSSKHESNQHDESDLMKFPCTLKNDLLIIRDRFGLSFASKGLGYLAAFFTIISTCSLQIILLSNYSATYNFSTLYKCFLNKFHLPKALHSPATVPALMTHKYRGSILALFDK